VQIIVESATQDFTLVKPVETTPALDALSNTTFSWLPPEGEESPFAADEDRPMDDPYPVAAQSGRPNGQRLLRETAAPVYQTRPPDVRPDSSLDDELLEEELLSGNDDDLTADSVAWTDSKPAAAGRRLVVRLHRTGDTQQDRRTLRWIYDIARSYPGRDHLRVVIYTPGWGKPIYMDFGKLGISVCDELIDQLCTRVRLDREGIEVQEM
jgi:hypothetical protein